MVTKVAKLRKCDCGEQVIQGSVFCLECKTIIEQKNSKVIDKENSEFNKKVLKS